MARTWTDEQLWEAVTKSKTVSQVISQLGLVVAGGNFESIKIHIERLKIDTSHFDTQTDRISRLHEIMRNRKPDELLFVENSSVKGGKLKKRFIASGVSYVCSECKLLPEWNGKKLVLQIDHINGINTDNRKENLRFLCPNCHSQTPTFAGKLNRKKPLRTADEISAARERKKLPEKRKCDHSAVRNEFQKNSNYSAVGRMFGISDNTVRKIVTK